jgi:cell wall-associated NlpC family hydrolase
MDGVIRVDDLIGVPFRKRGRDVAEGVDCFGLLMEAHRRLGKPIPDFASPEFLHEIEAALQENKRTWTCHWAKTGRDHVPLTVCTPGRSLLIAIKGQAIHVGFIHKPGWFIHCWEDTTGVTVERISLWKQRILGVYEFNG